MSYWLELQYDTSIGCTGSVGAALLFYTLDPTVYDHPANETWASLYAMGIDDNGSLGYPYYPCGNAAGFLPDSQQCCSESLDTSIETGTQGMTSGADIVIPSFDLSDAALSSYFLAGSSGASYCYLSSSPPASSSSDELVYGFNSVLIRRDDSLCVNINSIGGSATCSSNGTYMVYSNYSCTGDLVQVETLTSSFSNTSLPGVVGKVLVLGAASQTVGWIQSNPGNYLVPLFVNKFEILELALMVITMISSLGNVLYSLKLYHDSKYKNQKYVYITLLHLLWLLTVIACTLYIFVVFQNPIQAGLYSMFKFVARSLAYYATSIYSINSFALILKLSRRNENIAYVTITIVWLALEFGSFLYPALQFYAIPPLDIYTVSVAFIDQVAPWWVVIFFIVNLLPANMIALKICIHEADTSFFETLWRFPLMDPLFFQLDVLQVLLVCLYYTIDCLGTYTDIYGSDRTYFAFDSLLDLIVNVHATTNFYMLKRLSFIVKNLKNNVKLKSSHMEQQQRKSQRAKGATGCQVGNGDSNYVSSVGSVGSQDGIKALSVIRAAVKE